MSQSLFCDSFLLIYDKIYPSWIKEFLVVDASDYAVGAVLGQSKDKKDYAISYASKTLTGPS
jgi:hypothetical protein